MHAGMRSECDDCQRASQADQTAQTGPTVVPACVTERQRSYASRHAGPRIILTEVLI